MSTVTEARIEADPTVPIIRITRDFAGTPEQLFRAHTDPELFVRWVGPDSLRSRIDHWDARTGGSWRYVATHGDDEHAFRGCFHEVRPDRIVQTFTWEGMPDAVALETLVFEDLGGGRTRYVAKVQHWSAADRKTHEEMGFHVGWGIATDQLAEFAKTL